MHRYRGKSCALYEFDRERLRGDICWFYEDALEVASASTGPVNSDQSNANLWNGYPSKRTLSKRDEVEGRLKSLLYYLAIARELALRFVFSLVQWSSIGAAELTTRMMSYIQIKIHEITSNPIQDLCKIHFKYDSIIMIFNIFIWHFQ